MLSTLRGRLALLTTLIVAVAFALTGATIVGATGREQSKQLQLDLTERLAVLAGGPGEVFPGRGRPDGSSGGTRGPGGRGELAQLARNAERALGRGFFAVLRDGEGDVTATLGDVPATLPGLTPEGSPTRRQSDDGTDYLLLTSSRNPEQVVQIGADVDLLVGEGQRALTQRVLLVGAIATLLTGLITFVVAGLAAAPLRRLRRTTEDVAATEDLTTRVDVGDAPSEIRAVAEGLNTMLARLEGSRSAREAALHAARRFAADAGHELRTPLTAMQATLDTLERNPSMGAAMRAEMVGEIAEESRRLAGLVEALQVLARADAGLGDVTEAVDMVDVVAQAADAVAGRDAGVGLQLDLTDDSASVRGSAAWLRSIVDNLLRNAAVHGRGPDGTVTITVGLAAHGDQIRLTVDDDGPGFPAADRDRVFERFSRGADATSRPGSGLGLSLVAQLVALHGGSVRAGDAPASGARVEVILPRQIVGPAAATARGRTGPGTASGPPTD